MGRNKGKTSGKNELAEAVRERYPFISEEEAQEAADLLVKEVAKNMRSSRGDLATVGLDSEGDVDLSVYFVSDDAENIVRSMQEARHKGEAPRHLER